MTALQSLLELAQTERRQRPCPGCVRPCPCGDSSTCGCQCTWVCERAAGKLAGERPAVCSTLVPLAFEIAAFPLFALAAGIEDGCSVSFRCSDRTAIGLFRGVLRQLLAERRLYNEWVLSEQPGGECYTCQPNPDFRHEASKIENDVRAIANALHERLRRSATLELRKLALAPL